MNNMNSDIPDGMNSDISEKLSTILSDPSSLSKIMNIASGLFGSQLNVPTSAGNLSTIPASVDNFSNTPASVDNPSNIPASVDTSSNIPAPTDKFSSDLSFTDTASQVGTVTASAIPTQSASQTRNNNVLSAGKHPSMTQPSFKPSKGDRRCDLLNAIKPFLSHERAARADMLIRAMQISDLLKNAKNAK